MPSLAPYLQGWSPAQYLDGVFATILAYVHNGYVYVTGAITNQPPGLESEHFGEPFGAWPAVGATIMSGIPAELCPTHATTVILPIDPTRTSDPATPLLNMPVLYSTTVHPDGTWTFDNALPGHLNTPPSIGTYYYDYGAGPKAQYHNPLILTLVTGNARWPVSSATDTYKTKSLVRWLSGQFTSSDAAYALHGNRVHLAGHAQADVEAPSLLLVRGPRSIYEALPEDFPANVIPEPTTAVGPEGEVPLAAIGARTTMILTDDPIHAHGKSPPVSDRSPAERYGAGPPGPILPPLPNIKTPGGAHQTQGPFFVSGPSYECKYKFTKAEPELIITCYGPVKYPPLAFDVGPLLAQCNPAPPWYTLDLLLYAAGGYGFESIGEGEEIVVARRATVGCLPGHGEGVGCTGEIRCSPWFTITGALLPAGEPTAFIHKREEELKEAYGEPEGPEGEFGEPFVIGDQLLQGVDYSSFVLPAGGSQYKGVALRGEEHLPAGEQLASRLWTPAQATTIHVDFLGEIGKIGRCEGVLSISPYYELREFGLRRGDTLNLDLTGWRSSGGVVEIGPGSRAIIPRP